jgi:hypothetical protein
MQPHPLRLSAVAVKITNQKNQVKRTPCATVRNK